MIQKSMSRKDKSFGQLIDYLEKDEAVNCITWNLYSDKEDKKEIEKEFLDNAEYITKSRGSVYIYHEILSLQKNNLSLDRQIEVLESLVKEYINKRASEHLVYGVFHNDTDNLHCHLMISSNKISENKRVRLSKKEFAEIQKYIEEYKNKLYGKELEQTNFYQDKTKKQEKKKQTKKEFVKEQLTNIFKRSLSKSALDKALKNEAFEIYERAKTLGVLYEGKKYRLKTLGLDDEYKQTLKKFEKREQRQDKRADFKEKKKTNKRRDNKSFTR